MKRVIDDRVWDMLTEEERVSFTLQQAYGKSTWEAGEIVNRVHYKYLEIKQRAEKFISLFKDHLDKFGCIIPITNIDSDFKKYLELTITKRYSIKDTINIIENIKYFNASNRDIIITAELEKIIRNNEQGSKELIEFLKEFDRWNNFRILPLKFQEPSAYKRRNKNRYKKQLTYLVKMTKIAADYLEELYKTDNKTNILYLPLVYDFYSKVKIIPIDNSPFILTKISSYSLYVFNDELSAKSYINLIKTHNLLTPKSCKDGQVFWPKFRILIKSAYNYNNVEHISPSKKQLDQFFTPRSKIDENVVKRKRKK